MQPSYLPIIQSAEDFRRLPTIALPNNVIAKFTTPLFLDLVAYQLMPGNGGIFPPDYDITNNNRSWVQV